MAFQGMTWIVIYTDLHWNFHLFYWNSVPTFFFFFYQLGLTKHWLAWGHRISVNVVPYILLSSTLKWSGHFTFFAWNNSKVVVCRVCKINYSNPIVKNGIEVKQILHQIRIAVENFWLKWTLDQQIDGLVQERSNSIADALELLQSKIVLH